MKKLLLLCTLGLISGNLLATYIGPSLLGWYFDPPVQMAVNCNEPIRWAMQKLVIFQLAGSVVGMVIGFVVALFFFKKREQPSIHP